MNCKQRVHFFEEKMEENSLLKAELGINVYNTELENDPI